MQIHVTKMTLLLQDIWDIVVSHVVVLLKYVTFVIFSNLENYATTWDATVSQTYCVV